MIEGGIFYSELNDNLQKKINECFPKKVINFLYNEIEKPNDDNEYKYLDKLTKNELIDEIIKMKEEIKKNYFIK